MRMPGGLGVLAAATAAALLTFAGLAACARQPVPSDRPIRIVTGFYPLQFVAQEVGGDLVSVSSLAQPGAEPHDLELSPRQVATIVDAHLVVYLGGFQPAVDEAVQLEAKDTSMDVRLVVPLLDTTGQAHDHAGEPAEREPAGAKDPHLWLDPTRLATVAHAVADRLSVIDPADANGFYRRANVLSAQLRALDHEFRAGLARCERHEIVVSHAAFGYLAQRYGLHQVALSGLSPDAEPTPQRLAEVASQAREHDATTIFFESLVSSKVAQAIAGEIGAATAVLDPIEGAPAGSDYLGAMRANLSALKPALGCAP